MYSDPEGSAIGTERIFEIDVAAGAEISALERLGVSKGQAGITKAIARYIEANSSEINREYLPPQ